MLVDESGAERQFEEVRAAWQRVDDTLDAVPGHTSADELTQQQHQTNDINNNNNNTINNSNDDDDHNDSNDNINNNNGDGGDDDSDEASENAAEESSESDNDDNNTTISASKAKAQAFDETLLADNFGTEQQFEEARAVRTTTDAVKPTPPVVPSSRPTASSDDNAAPTGYRQRAQSDACARPHPSSGKNTLTRRMKRLSMAFPSRPVHTDSTPDNVEKTQPLSR